MLSAPIEHAAIEALIPHKGRMCLLDRALTWDESHIVCETARHRDTTNPLRRDGRLPAVCGLEFAFQAMALHGALLAASAQPVGFLSSLRGVTLGAERLDDLPGPLIVEATALVAESGGFIYRFAVSHERSCILSGQAAIILAREGARA